MALATDPRLVSYIAQTVDRTTRRVEATRNVTVLPSVRRLAEDVIAESLTVRAPEWQAREGIDVALPFNQNPAVDLAADRYERVLNDAPPIDFQGQRVVTLRSFFESIVHNFCGIYPFC